MKKVRVITRDMQNRPHKVAIGEESGSLEVVVERWGIAWQPLYALKGKDEITLPRGFELNRDSLKALDAAQ